MTTISNIQLRLESCSWYSVQIEKGKNYLKKRTISQLTSPRMRNMNDDILLLFKKIFLRIATKEITKKLNPLWNKTLSILTFDKSCSVEYRF